MSDEEAKMRAMIRKELCCVLEKPSVARRVLAPRVMAMFKFLQAGQLFNKKSLKLKYI